MRLDPEKILDSARRHWLPILGVTTIAAALMELWLVPEWAKAINDWYRKHVLDFVLYTGLLWLVCFLVLVLWRVLNKSLYPADYKDRRDLLQLLVQMLGGALIVFGVYSTWQTLQIARSNLDVTREGQVTERFGRAIDQLGSDKPEVRLGGIYVLQQTEKLYPEDYRNQVFEVFSAYIRTNSLCENNKEEPAQRRRLKREDKPLVPTPRSIEIQAILSFLGRKSHDANERLYLTGANLLESKLRGAHFENAIFRNICTNNTDFSGAYLMKADFQHSQLAGSTVFTNAQLDGAIFTDAKAEHAVFAFAKLDGAVFVGTHLEGANFSSAILDEADFYMADLRDADFQGVDLTKAKRLTQNQIDCAKTNERTRVPENLHLPAKASLRTPCKS